MLPLEHGAGNFRCVGEVADSRFQHFYPRFAQTLLNFDLEDLTDFIGASAQGNGLSLVVVIGVTGCHVANGGFALDRDVVFVIVNFEDGFCSVNYSPDDHGGDLYWIAGRIVDLELTTLEITDSQ